MQEAGSENISLERLMHLAQQGDQAAYESLFRAITPILRAFVMRRLGSQADAEDVLQNILLSIHRAGRTYDSNRSFKVWMFAIARYRLNDHFRQIYKKGAFPEIRLDDLTYEISAGDVTVEQDRYEYLNRMLSEMLTMLPEKQRKIVTMMKLEGHSVEEIARIMNMSVSAVKVAAHRAYKALALKAEEAQEKDRYGNR